MKRRLRWLGVCSSLCGLVLLLLPLLSALLYLLSALLLFDSSWFSFTFLYAVLSFAGHGAGRWLRRMIEREQTAGKNV